MTNITIDHVFQLAQQLPLEQRKLLILRMEREIDSENLPIATTIGSVDQSIEEKPSSASPIMKASEARAMWQLLRESMLNLPQSRMTLAEQLEADRRDRDQALLGYDIGAHNVDA